MLQSGNEFVAHSGLSGFPQVLMNGSPLKKQYLAQDSFEEGVVNEILKATPSVQKAVYHVSSSPGGTPWSEPCFVL